jgi:DnaJ-related protein SCJ1
MSLSHRLPLFIILVCVLATVVLCGKDYYQILGLKRDASTKEIKKAYRDLSLKWHPDKHAGNKEAEQKFMEISQAYEILSDENKRRTYDQFGEEGLKQGPGGMEHRNPWDMFNIFNQNQGQRGGNNQKKNPNVEIPLEVTLQDLYLGSTFRVAHKKQTLCTRCRGTGAKDANDVTTCPVCKGSGVKTEVHQIGPGFIQQTQSTCDKCGGRGRIVKSVCPLCKGTKVGHSEDKITVVVEQGMIDGDEIRFENEADEQPDVIPGDLVFKIVTVPNKRFVRQGDNLHTKLNITLLEALVGFSKSFKHLDGHRVVVERDTVTIPGQVVRIAEEGMPKHNYASEKGDLFVEFTVIFPESLSQEQKEGFKQLLANAK